MYCGTDFGIGHGGRSDVKRHVETEGHRNAVVDAKQTGRSTVQYRAPNSMYLSCFFVTLKLLQVNATMTCARVAANELREKKQLPTTMLRSSRKMRVMTSRVSYKDICFIHYVILLHKYIGLPILYKYFGIFYCESEIKYSENVY